MILNPIHFNMNGLMRTNKQTKKKCRTKLFARCFPPNNSNAVARFDGNALRWFVGHNCALCAATTMQCRHPRISSIAFIVAAHDGRDNSGRHSVSWSSASSSKLLGRFLVFRMSKKKSETEYTVVSIHSIRFRYYIHI